MDVVNCFLVNFNVSFIPKTTPPTTEKISGTHPPFWKDRMNRIVLDLSLDSHSKKMVDRLRENLLNGII